MLDWREIDTVLLDMDGTLLDLHYDNHFWLDHLPKRYAEIHSLPLDRAQRQLHEEIEALRGTLEWYCLDYWERKLQLDVTEMLRETEDRIALRPQTESFLEGLQKLNKNVYLVTNSHPRGLEHKLEISGIDRWLDGVVSSHDLGHAKEHPDFWAALSKTIVFDADRTLFVDDNESVLAAARDYGIGQLLCIRQPDSRGPLREITEFPAIHQFDEIMEIQETSD